MSIEKRYDYFQLVFCKPFITVQKLNNAYKHVKKHYRYAYKYVVKHYRLASTWKKHSCRHQALGCLKINVLNDTAPKTSF